MPGSPNSEKFVLTISILQAGSEQPPLPPERPLRIQAYQHSQFKQYNNPRHMPPQTKPCPIPSAPNPNLYPTLPLAWVLNLRVIKDRVESRNLKWEDVLKSLEFTLLTLFLYSIYNMIITSSLDNKSISNNPVGIEEITAF